MKKQIVVALAMGAMATGCATRSGTGALLGAGTGAAVGAGVGAIVGQGQGAAIGAGVGGVVGAGTGALIGKYMDDQEEKLKKLKSAKVEREGDKLVVEFKSAILFDVNKADLKAEAQTDLKEFANVLSEFKETNVVIEGHTDNTGDDAYNKELSLKRAKSVIAALTSAGVDTSRLTPVGYGEEKPAADNATAEGRTTNRRVEIQIKANEKLKEQDAKAAAAQPTT